MNRENEPSTPSSVPVEWNGWLKRNPLHSVNVTCQFWYDARNMIARELGAKSLSEVVVVRRP